MNLKNQVCEIVDQADKGLTVTQVVHELALRIETDIRSALNDLAEEGKISCNRGAGPYQSTYHQVHKVPLVRRF